MEAKKYKDLIDDKGLKITWVANKIGVSQPYLSMVLSERRKMRPDIEDKLKKVLL